MTSRRQGFVRKEGGGRVERERAEEETARPGPAMEKQPMLFEKDEVK